jgi:hypothetical protein
MMSRRVRDPGGQVEVDDGASHAVANAEAGVVAPAEHAVTDPEFALGEVERLRSGTSASDPDLCQGCWRQLCNSCP